MVRPDRLQAADEGRVPSAEPEDGQHGAHDLSADRRGGGAVQEHAQQAQHRLPGEYISHSWKFGTLHT